MEIYAHIVSPINGRAIWPHSSLAPLIPPDVEEHVVRHKKARNKKGDEPICF